MEYHSTTPLFPDLRTAAFFRRPFRTHIQARTEFYKNEFA